RAVRAFGQAVFLGYDVSRFFSKQFWLEQIAHAQAAPRHLVFVSWTDSARRRADFVGAARDFRRFVQFSVIRKNQVRTVADVEPPAYIDARFRKSFNPRDQRRGIHHHAGANHRVLLRPQNSAGNELQDIALFANDDRVSGIVPAGDARDVIKRTGQIIANLTFALISPFRANHYDRLHSLAFSSHFPRFPGNSHGLSGPHSSPSTTS